MVASLWQLVVGWLVLQVVGVE